MPGAGWVWPPTLDGVRVGDEALVVAHLPEGEPLKILVDGVEQSGAVEVGSPALIERTEAVARVGDEVACQAVLKFAIVDRDPATCPLDDLRATKVLRTVVGGKIAYEAESL